MAHRTFTDSHGRFWDVWDVEPTLVERRKLQAAVPRGGERRTRREIRAVIGDEWAHGWLAFETRSEKRRLAPFPGTWVAISDQELEKLCVAARPVRPPRRLAE